MIDINSDFTKHHISKAYRAMSEFKKDYYGLSEKESSNQITPSQFIDLYPLCHKGRLEPTNLDDTLQVRTYYRIRNCETKA